MVLIGVTGSGKSTLAKYLTQDPNLSAVVGKGRQCIFNDKDGTIGIQTQTSMTTVPNAISDNKTGQMLIDCPGFEDTRKNPANDIAAAFFIRKVFEKAQRIKIVLVENHFALSFGKSRDSFLRTLEHVAQLIPSGIPFIGSFGLIATKVDSTDTDEDIIYAIREFVNDTLVGHLQPEMENLKGVNNTEEIWESIKSQKSIINTILAFKENIGIFRVPCKKKDKNQTVCLDCHTTGKLRKLVLKRLFFTDSDSSLFRMSVSQTSKLFIKDKLIPNAEKAVETKLKPVTTQLSLILDSSMENLEYTTVGTVKFLRREKNDMPPLLDELCINPSSMPLKNKQWKLPTGKYLEELDFEVQLLQFFYASTMQNITTRMHERTQSQKTLLSGRADFLLAELQSEAQFQSFVDSIHSHEVMAAKNANNIPNPEKKFEAFIDDLFIFGLQNTTELIQAKMSTSRRFISKVTESWENGLFCPSQVNKLDNGVLYVTGSFVFLSKILNKTEATRLFYVIATKAIFIDTDLSLKSTHLILRAPVIEVIGVQNIQMKGSDGQFVTTKGQRGNRGYSSGTVQILAGLLVNGPQLKIISVGGSGSSGMSGHNGLVGQDASLQYEIRDILQCLWWKDKDECTRNFPNRELETIDYNRAYHYIASSICRNGKAPSSGGSGGDGGIGGTSGDISVLHSRGQHPKVDTLDGYSGKGGQGGKSGGSACTQQKFVIKCSLYLPLWNHNIDKCHYESTTCLKRETANVGTNGLSLFSPRATQQYSYPVPDESLHYKAEAYLLRSLAAAPDGKKLLSDFANMPRI